MSGGDLLPKGEKLRRAIAWIAERGRHDAASVEEACRRFDLSPRDEEFVLRHFAGRESATPPGESDGH